LEDRKAGSEKASKHATEKRRKSVGVRNAVAQIVS
jgi:hypothetical protein